MASRARLAADAPVDYAPGSGLLLADVDGRMDVAVADLARDLREHVLLGTTIPRVRLERVPK